MIVSLTIGFFGGMIGAPGAFIYIPIMLYILNIPTRIVIGSILGVVLLGTIPGASIGSILSKQVPTKYLRKVIAVIIAITGIRMWHQIIGFFD